MCGIVGARHDWLVARGLDPAAAMQSAVDALRWRGPDGVGVVRAGAWWLGCARLAIGPKHSRQPLVRRGGRFVCVMNGAITNARELWPRFLPGIEQRAQLPNDAWLPLLAVERGDLWLLEQLRGHHAFAVADTLTGELFCSRDLYGEKPLLCVTERRHGTPGLVAFASTPPALRSFDVVPDLSERRLSEWFRLGWTRSLRTRSVAGWHVEELRRGLPQRAGLDTSLASWRPTHREDPGVRPWIGIRPELVASVLRCTDTRVPVALALSGGIDSSCLAIALAEANRRIPAYQLCVAGGTRAERDAARAIATRIRLELRTVDIDVEASSALPHLTACAGVPLGDPSVLAMHALARAAATDGVRVLLGGEGADEAFFGYRRYRALQHLPNLRALRRFAPDWSMRYAARWFRAATAPDPVFALLAVTPPAFGESVLAPQLTRRRFWGDDSDSRWRLLQRRSGVDAAGARGRDLGEYLPSDLLPKVDVATMAAGIEARCPYLESWIEGYATRGRRELGKRALREAFANELPREVLRLPKTGFALPLDRWFRGELPWLDLLAEPRTQQRPHLRPGGVAKVVDMHRSGRADLGHGLYLLVAYELYLRFCDEENSAPRHTGPPAAT